MTYRWTLWHHWWVWFQLQRSTPLTALSEQTFQPERAAEHFLSFFFSLSFQQICKTGLWLKHNSRAKSQAPAELHVAKRGKVPRASWAWASAPRTEAQLSHSLGQQSPKKKRNVHQALGICCKNSMLFSTEQTPLSRMLSGHREGPEAEKDKHQLSDHSLTLEAVGQTWQPGENRLCQFCQQQEIKKRATVPATLRPF